jgi:basic amino acid/polyamine antiporter, APA family
MNAESQASKPRKTLGLTGITLNAMALTAPGALIWLLYQVQSAALFGGVADIWPGVLLALLGALLTAFSFGELVRRYPEAGFRSAYHFADRYFAEHRGPRQNGLIRAAKFVIGWAAHLYYWVYPGVMVAFMGVLADYLLRFLGYRPTVFGEVILAMAFAAFVGFLALRGITGSLTTSVVLNTVQLVALLLFSVLALAFRLSNPAGIAASAWLHPAAGSVLQPHDWRGVLFQGALGMILMLGFESSTTLRAAASNPQRDVPRSAVLALVIQGVLVYLLGYFAAGFAMNAGIDASGSRAPIGDLAVQIGDRFLNGHGATLMIFIGLTIALALFGANLTAVNNGVRVSFSMTIDDEMPEMLGLLPPQYATPSSSVLVLSGVSALIGAAGILGGLPALMGVVLAANLGAFLLYALLCALTIATFAGKTGFHFFRHLLLPAAGLIVNLGTLAVVSGIGLGAGGELRLASLIALGIASFWLVLSLAYYLLKR